MKINHVFASILYNNKLGDNFSAPELGTLEWDTINPDPDCLIRISNVETLNYLLNPLFFGHSTEKLKTGFSKFDHRPP